MKTKINSGLFIAIVLSLSLLFVMLPKRAYSDNENRYLAQMPAFSFASLFDGSFTKGVEDYVTDGFPFRDTWISLKGHLDLAMGRRDTNGVYVTKDGYLMEMFTEIDAERYARNISYLKDAQEKYQDEMAGFNVILVPTASHILQDKIGKYSADLDQGELLAEAEGLNLLDAEAILKLHKDEDIYFRNDHHWTGLGAYYVYQGFMGDAAYELGYFEEELLSDEFLGTTYSKAGLYEEYDSLYAYKAPGAITVEHNLSGVISDTIYDRTFLEKKDKYSTFLGGNQALTVIKTENEGGKLLLIKDSYANSFVQFLLPHYSEIHIVDLRNFAKSIEQYSLENEITDVLVLYNLKGFSEETTIFRIAK